MDDARQAPLNYDALAHILEYPLLAPELTEDQVYQGCLLAIEYALAAVIVRPADADAAVRALSGSIVIPASVVSWPEGSCTTAVKQYEARDLLRRGIREVNAVIGSGKMLSRQFPHIESELLQLASACRETEADLTAIFEFAHFAQDHRVIAAKLIRRTGLTFASPATGRIPAAGSHADLAFLHERCSPACRIKSFAPAETLDEALALYALGCHRIVTHRPASILDEWKSRLASQPAPAGPSA
jgi:deoxyribose-phosphate aldolase